jgi:hypothetical protein
MSNTLLSGSSAITADADEIIIVPAIMLANIFLYIICSSFNEAF